MLMALGTKAQIVSSYPIPAPDTVYVTSRTVIVVADSLLPDLASNIPASSTKKFMLQIAPTATYFSRFTRYYSGLKYQITLYPGANIGSGVYTMKKL